MTQILTIKGIQYDYNYCCAWIKYNRLKSGISQEALAYKICSNSHLSYFENGKKKLRPEIVEALLKKLNFEEVRNPSQIGTIRQLFNELMLHIEIYDFEQAERTFRKIDSISEMLEHTIFNIEFMVYKTAFRILVKKNTYIELQDDINLLNKVYSSLNDHLKYIFSIACGKLTFDFKDHHEGIVLLKRAQDIKNTSWVNYRLGVSYCYDNKHYQALKYLKSSLSDYEKSGRYYNALLCHKFLGICLTTLGDYSEAERHYKTVMDGSDYFSMNKNIWSIYTNFADLYLQMEKYELAIEFSLRAIEYSKQPQPQSPWSKSAWHLDDEPVIAACLYVEACIKLGQIERTTSIFDEFLKITHSRTWHYSYLRFLYLSIDTDHNHDLYTETTNVILPYYKKIGFLNIHKKILIGLAIHLESKRQYKAANTIYKQLM